MDRKRHLLPPTVKQDEHIAKKARTSKEIYANPRMYMDQKYSFLKPKHVAVYSKNNAVVHFNSSAKKYLCLPLSMNRVDFNLNDGLESYLEKEFSNGDLDHLLQWIKHRDISGGPVVAADVVCWRGTLTRLAASLYQSRDAWRLAVSRLNDVIYIRELETDEKTDRRLNQSDREKRMSYWGHKFEQYVTSDEREGKPRTDVDVDTNVEFAVVASTRLDDHRLLFAGETDCVDGTNEELVELKTHRILQHEGHQKSFRRFKLLTWWLQCFLIGVPQLLVGYRDDDGYVTSCERMRVSALPGMARGFWDGGACLAYLSALLRHFRQTATEENRVYVFEGSPGEPVRHRCYTRNSSSDVSSHADNPQPHQCTINWDSDEVFWYVLPDWFITHKKQLNKSELLQSQQTIPASNVPNAQDSKPS